MISKFSVKKPYTVLVGVVLAIVLGVVAYILLTFVEPNFRKYAFPQCREAKFVLAKLGNDAGIYGAAALILRNNG